MHTPRLQYSASALEQTPIRYGYDMVWPRAQCQYGMRLVMPSELLLSSSLNMRRGQKVLRVRARGSVSVARETGVGAG